MCAFMGLAMALALDSFLACWLASWWHVLAHFNSFAIFAEPALLLNYVMPVGRLLIFILFFFVSELDSVPVPVPAFLTSFVVRACMISGQAKIFGSGMFAQLFADNPVLLFNKSCQPSLQTVQPVPCLGPSV